jgi:hypothetical protein
MHKTMCDTACQNSDDDLSSKYSEEHAVQMLGCDATHGSYSAGQGRRRSQGVASQKA